MVQIFDDWRDEGERVVHKNISGPTADGYYEMGGRVYQHDPLTAAQDKAWDDHVNSVVQLSRNSS